PGLQPLVQQPEPVALPHQQLHPIALAVEEHEHVAGQRLLAQDLLHLCAQPIERPAQVRRAARHKDSYRRRQRQHVVWSAWSTRCSVSLSAPAGTRTRCPLCKTISRTAAVPGTFAGGDTSVNTTAGSAAAPFPSSSPA